MVDEAVYFCYKRRIEKGVVRWGESANSIKLSDESKSKMWLSHYQDFVSEGKDFSGNKVDWEVSAVEDGFLGFVEVGQEIQV